MYSRMILMGRLTRDPELKSTESGKYFVSERIAIDRRYNREETDFFDIVAWEKTAEFIAQYFKKGQMIHVDGRPQNREYTDKNGHTVRTTECIVREVDFCGGKNEGGGSSAEVVAKPARGRSREPELDIEVLTVDQDGDFSDDLPF